MSLETVGWSAGSGPMISRVITLVPKELDRASKLASGFVGTRLSILWQWQ